MRIDTESIWSDMANFFTGWNQLSFPGQPAKRRGRTRRTFEEIVRTKAWYQAVKAASGAANANQIALKFECEDSGLWQKYQNGINTPDVYLRLAGQRYPQTSTIFHDGPNNLWKAMFGTPRDCWKLAQVLDENLNEFVGYSVPIETCVTRLCRLYAEEFEHGAEHQLENLVQLVAMFRLHTEISKVTLLENEGLYEIVWTLFHTSPSVYTSLDNFGIATDVIRWIANEQQTRIAFDNRYRLAIAEVVHPEEEDDLQLRYLRSPLAIVATSRELRKYHGYLDAMPSILSSL